MAETGRESLSYADEPDHPAAGLSLGALADGRSEQKLRHTTHTKNEA
jgi:hypothetical protein